MSILNLFGALFNTNSRPALNGGDMLHKFDNVSDAFRFMSGEFVLGEGGGFVSSMTIHSLRLS